MSYCGKRLIAGVDAVRRSIAPRAALKLTAALDLVVFLPRLPLLESRILILPLRLAWVSSSSASNSSELLTLIVVPVAFPPPPGLADDVTRFVLSNDGAFSIGCGSLAPAPPNVPVVELLPPNPV